VKTKKIGSYSVLIFAFAILAIAMSLGGPTAPGQSVAAVGLTVTYEDGTTRDVDPLKGLSIFGPLRITDSTGKSITQLDYYVKVKAYFTGTPSNIDYTGSSVYIGVDQRTKKTLGASAFHGSPVNGEWKTVCSETITKTLLESWSGSHGSHSLQITPTVLLNLSFSDGTSITKEASMQAQWNYEYEPDGTFTGLSITVETVPLS
jgi:hypothetical protein